MLHQKISFAGAGRVASALCRKMYAAGHNIELIVSLSEANGRYLSESCGASWSKIPEFPPSSDLIIVAVPDHSLRSVLNDLSCSPETLVVHTAGSFGLEVFPERIKKRGVFYPLQTFSRERIVDFTGLPFLLESSDARSSAIMEELAQSAGGRTLFVNSEQRLMIHLAAVFICNFANHMLTGGWQVAEKAGVPFEIFFPLLQETVLKAMDLGPEKSQTGPAVRNDTNTISKHIELLSFAPDLQKLYEEVTISIIKYHSKL
jgi:predicted short-subunit dehydrogenase-like oxidoreductase (DUF2520 family)